MKVWYGETHSFYYNDNLDGEIIIDNGISKIKINSGELSDFLDFYYNLRLPEKDIPYKIIKCKVKFVGEIGEKMKTVNLSELNPQTDIIAEYLLNLIYRSRKNKLNSFKDNEREIRIDITKDQIKKVQICSICHSEVIKDSYICPKGDICKDENGDIWVTDGYRIIELKKG